MILLVDLIGLAGVSLQHFKVHLATGDNPPPLEAFLDGKFRDWQADQAQRNFQCDQVLSLIHTSADQWLFAGVFAVRGVKPRIVRGRHRFWYDTVELPGLDHLTGRAVVEYLGSVPPRVPGRSTPTLRHSGGKTNESTRDCRADCHRTSLPQHPCFSCQG